MILATHIYNIVYNYYTYICEKFVQYSIKCLCAFAYIGELLPCTNIGVLAKRFY